MYSKHLSLFSEQLKLPYTCNMASSTTTNHPLFIRRLINWLWSPQRISGNPVSRIFFQSLRYLIALFRDINNNLIRLHAVNFVYTILLSLVPLLALCFSILKGFNIHRNDDVINLLQQFLQPLGPKSIEITQKILEFVENIRGDLLGLFGVLFLLYTVISMIRKIEVSFNEIFESPLKHNFAKRLTEYFGVLVIAPILMIAAITLGTTISNNSLTLQLSEYQPFGYMIANFGKLVPTLLVIVNFTFLYKFIPNTHVKFKNALFGGAIAGLTWSIIGFLFASFVASSTRYTAIYSSFAIMIIFLMWLYFSCVILLLGARLVYYLENPQYLRRGSNALALSPSQRFSLACDMMSKVSKEFQSGTHQWNTQKLSMLYGIPSKNVEQIYRDLEKSELLTRNDEDDYLPNKQPNLISLRDIAEALFDDKDWSIRLNLDTRLRETLDGSVDDWYQKLNEFKLEDFY